MTPATVLTFEGITQPVTEWALDYGIAPAVIVARLERGVSVEQAITTPMVTARGQKLKGEHLESYIADQRYAWRRDRRLVIRAAMKAGKLAASEAARQHKASQQARGKGRVYTFDGQSKTLEQWSQQIGVAASTLRKRVTAGWPIERVLTSTDGRADRHRPGVVSNFETLRGTGAGSTAQEIPEITFSEQAENA
ncbi:hypothetical protein EN794_050545 [Mesorhizobium sp. M00.F.Ca.ET.151.01.1.1]|nr:hypothetical protein EN794_050545 [Mesorhizobium sp. M00.F.Ca.ET.151.01.1.1]